MSCRERERERETMVLICLYAASKLSDTKKLDDTIKEKLAAVSQEEDETEEIDNDRQFAESVSSFGRETQYL